MRIADAEELRAKLERKQRLVTASIEITRRCNLRCVHCLRNLGSDDGLTFGDVCNVIDQLVDLGCINLTFTGGEPFARRDFMDILRHAWDRRLAVTIMTNGLLLTPALAAELKRLHVSDMQFSLYAADPAIHDQITQQPGSQRRTLRAIDLAREQGLRIRIAMPLMAANADQSPAVEALCKERGLRFTQGALIFPKNDGGRQPLRLLASSQQMERVLVRGDGENCDAMPVSQQDVAPPPLCSAGRDRLGVGADGSVYPCDAWRVSLGNVRSDRLADIWFHSSLLFDVRSARRRHPMACDGCSARRQCLWCPGLSLDLLGRADVPNPQDCRRTRLSFARPSADAAGWTVPDELRQC